MIVIGRAVRYRQLFYMQTIQTILPHFGTTMLMLYNVGFYNKNINNDDDMTMFIVLLTTANRIPVIQVNVYEQMMIDLYALR